MADVAAGPAPFAPLTAEPGARHLRYEARTGTVVGILLSNLALGLATLGFYRFWGKTRLRRTLWHGLRFDGEPLEYAGTGRELFLGFVIAVAVFVLPLYALTTGAGLLLGDVAAAAAINALVLPVAFIAYQLGLYRARGYRLSRTVLRGIRWSQSGTAPGYALRAVPQALLLVLTAGLSLPFRNVALQRYRTANTWYGDARFAFDGRGAALLPRWLLAWLLFVPSFGLSYPWYRAAEFRYFAEHTAIAGLRFRSALGGGQLAWLYIKLFVAAAMAVLLVVMPVFALVAAAAFESGAAPGADPLQILSPLQNVALIGASVVLVLVLGLLNTLIMAHGYFRLLGETLWATGTVDYAAIARRPAGRPRAGEGLADVFGIMDF